MTPPVKTTRFNGLPENAATAGAADVAATVAAAVAPAASTSTIIFTVAVSCLCSSFGASPRSLSLGLSLCKILERTPPYPETLQAANEFTLERRASLRPRSVIHFPRRKRTNERWTEIDPSGWKE